MKKLFTMIAMVLLTLGAFAQKLNYQAVVRNSNNELVANKTMQVTVTILDAANAEQYAETHANVESNQNGLISLMIGDGTPKGTSTMPMSTGKTPLSRLKSTSTAAQWLPTRPLLLQYHTLCRPATELLPSKT